MRTLISRKCLQGIKIARQEGKCYFILFLIAVHVFSVARDCHAQGSTLKPDLGNVILPSPNAAALGKFGSIPVSPSNGIPKITVPIFEREGGASKCGLSISLDYHAGGIRVDEMASNVGLGWALNAGGVITRTIRGIADETNLSGVSGFLAPGHTLPGSSDGVGYTTQTSTYYTPGRMLSDGRLDGQIDVYSFNFNGRSGKFLLGKNGDILITPQQKLVIEKITGNGTTTTGKITITAEDGFKYEFAEEESTNSSYAAVIRDYPTAWYLSKIFSPGKADSITFQYETFNGSYTVAHVASEINVIQTGYYNEYNMYISAPDPPYTFTNYPVTEGGSYKRLSKVLFSDLTEINFTYDTQNRTDWVSDRALKFITISNNGEVYKKFQLDQRYSSSRLFLDKVILKDAADVAIGNYGFEYTYDNLLPARLSASQDHWGFPNSNSDGRMIPKEYCFGKTYLGGNRNANGWAVYGTIKKMTYPTGGYTLFEMEPNWARDIGEFGGLAEYYVDGLFNYEGTGGLYKAESMIGGVRIKKISDYDGNGSDPAMVREYSYIYPDGNSSGVIANYPRYSNSVFYQFDRVRPGDPQYPPPGYWNWPVEFITVPGYMETYIRRQFNIVNRASSSLTNLGFALGSPVTYKRVEEKLSGKAGASNGKIVRTFTAFWDYGPPADYSMFNYPQPPASISDWLYGLMKSELIYDSNGRLVKKTENIYDKKQDNTLTSTRLQNFRSITTAPVKFLTGDIMFPVLGGPPVYWLLNNFYPVSGSAQLSSTTVTTYDSNGDSLVAITNNKYDSLNFYMRSRSVQKSDESSVTTTYKYPKDMVNEGKDPAGIFNQMVSGNIINQVIEQVDTLSRASTTQQLKWVGMQYSNPTGSLYLPRSSAVKNLAYPVDTISKFNRYSSNGNILEQQKVNGVKEVYLWGYRGQYPIAKIVNSDYATVNSVITQTQIDNATVTGDAALRSLLNTLRTDSRLKNAQVTTYTYKPLVGITSFTDAKGLTVFYEYDKFQRLKIIKDKDGKILKVFDYQYSKPVTQ